jgi:hypothetical protein
MAWLSACRTSLLSSGGSLALMTMNNMRALSVSTTRVF